MARLVSIPFSPRLCRPDGVQAGAIFSPPTVYEIISETPLTGRQKKHTMGRRMPREVKSLRTYCLHGPNDDGSGVD
jgi:hypothetical protein